MPTVLPIAISNTIIIICSKFLKRFCPMRNKKPFKLSEFLHAEKNQEFLQLIHTIKIPNVSGRPKPKFSKICEKSKKRRVDDLESSFTPETIEGYFTEFYDSSAISKSLFPNLDRQKVELKLAVSMISLLKLSVRKFESLKLMLNDMLEFPSYYAINKFKQTEIYLPLALTENSAICDLFYVVESTIRGRFERLMSTGLFKVKRNLPIKAFFKWGADGCSNMTQLKLMKQLESTNDQNIFSCMIAFLSFSQNGEVIGQVKNASSPYICRPVQIYAQKETIELSKKVQKSILEQIEKISTIHVEYDGDIYDFEPEFINSMVDGKVVNCFEGITWTKKCYLCLKGGKELNDMAPGSISMCSMTKYQYGAQPLHALIRSLDFILDLAYKLPNSHILDKKERVNAQKDTKRQIHDRYYQVKGLNIDMPYQQSGNTNDGNMARKVFSDVKFFSEATGVDENFIETLKTCIACLSSSQHIDPHKYLATAKECYQIWKEKYATFEDLGPTIHKILVHGHEFIEVFEMQIGILIEQCIESCNKLVKYYREDHTSKSSRQNMMRDIFNFLLVQSWPHLAPYIAVIANEPENKIKFADLDDHILIGDQ